MKNENILLRADRRRRREKSSKNQFFTFHISFIPFKILGGRLPRHPLALLAPTPS